MSVSSVPGYSIAAFTSSFLDSNIHFGHRRYVHLLSVSVLLRRFTHDGFLLCFRVLLQIDGIYGGIVYEPRSIVMSQIDPKARSV